MTTDTDALLEAELEGAVMGNMGMADSEWHEKSTRTAEERDRSRSVTTDTDQLLATVREALERDGSWAPPDHEADPEALAALESFAVVLEVKRRNFEDECVAHGATRAELERLRRERDSCRDAYNKQADHRREMEAELERVKAERDDTIDLIESWREHAARHEASASAWKLKTEAALSALREIADTKRHHERDMRMGYEIARAAIAEIEGEA